MFVGQGGAYQQMHHIFFSVHEAQLTLGAIESIVGIMYSGIGRQPLTHSKDEIEPGLPFTCRDGPLPHLFSLFCDLLWVFNKPLCLLWGSLFPYFQHAFFFQRFKKYANVLLNYDLFVFEQKPFL